MTSHGSHPPNAQHPAPSTHASIWPVVCAGGLALLAFGVLTSLLFSAAGVLLLIWSLVGWVAEMRHG